ncbi:hypothetical protein [Aequorivita flava]|uniref:Uncharacterized protein n=1 Tax=Aequorivita flava TaxID=3114371 RepID=A0AB35YWA8_9FLAO
MDTNSQFVQNEMRRLVAISCMDELCPNSEFQELHKELLLFSFGAVKVTVDYGKKLISIWNSKPLTTSPVRLFNMKDAVADTLSYTSLEETLAGCLKSGQLQDKYYKTLLLKYSNFLNNDDHFLSA